MFYDKKTNNYYWIHENNIVNYKDNTILNFKYNHEPEVIFANHTNNELNTNNFYTKFVKIGNKLVKIILIATISLYSLSGCTIQNNTFSSEDTTLVESIENEETISYNWETLKEVIKNNINLKEKDKEIIYKLKFIFDENHQYMDLSLVYERLSSLKIVYNASLPYINAGGVYNVLENKIQLASENIAGFIHEFLHVLQGNGGKFTKELSNEFFARETLIRLYKENLLDKEVFLGDYYLEEKKKGNIEFNNEADWLYSISIGGGYQDYIGIYYVLADILPSEILRKYQFNPARYDIIVDELDKITYEHDQTYMIGMGYKVLNMINSIGYDNYTGELYDYNKEVEKNNKIYENLEYYYRTIKGMDFKQNLFISMILSKGNGIDYSGPIHKFMVEKYNLDFSYYINLLIPKTYLSDCQKNQLYVYANTDNSPRIFEADLKVAEEYYKFSLENNKVK